MAPNLSTLDDLERPKRPSFRNRKVLLEVAAPTRKIWMKIDTNCQRENVDQWFRFLEMLDTLGIFARVPWGGPSNHCGL